MTDKKLMQQALDALENGKRVRNAEGGTKYQPDLECKAITALRESLAQPAQQEPYGWVRPNPSFSSGVFSLGAQCPPGWVGSAVAVYTAPQPAQPAQRTWVDLTDEDIESCYGGEVNDFARAVLAKSKEQNT